MHCDLSKGTTCGLSLRRSCQARCLLARHRGRGLIGPPTAPLSHQGLVVWAGYRCEGERPCPPWPSGLPHFTLYFRPRLSPTCFKDFSLSNFATGNDNSALLIPRAAPIASALLAGFFFK